MNPVERVIYALGGVRAKQDMTGWQYARIAIPQSRHGIFVYLLIMFQDYYR